MSFLSKLFGHRINEPEEDQHLRYYQDALARDVAARKKLVGEPYAARRKAAKGAQIVHRG